MKYDITNAIIHTISEMDSKSEGCKPYLLGFTENTVVEPINSSFLYKGPAFMPIVNIPKTLMGGQQFGNIYYSIILVRILFSVSVLRPN